MKSINNRENIWDVKLTDTHFVRERESRYGKQKNQMKINGYRRSNSRNGYWKNGVAVLVISKQVCERQELIQIQESI